jgi:peptidoglycan/xylan/chitin deacetylase (PgdA/CDA1 family)
MVTRSHSAGRVFGRAPRALRIGAYVIAALAVVAVYLLLRPGSHSSSPLAASGPVTPTLTHLTPPGAPPIKSTTVRRWVVGPAALASVPVTSAVAKAGTGRAEVALTFDDGPSIYTASVLRALRARGARATFFVIGRQVAGNEALLRRMVDEGDEIGDHTWSHSPLTAIDRSAAKSEITGAAQAIVTASGSPPAVLRPPYGVMQPGTNRLVRELGLVPIVWSVDTRDYRNPTARQIARAVLSHATRGSIILLHDGGGDRSATVEALPRILAGLRRLGLKPVTVTQLLNDAPPTPGGLVEKE